jgi:hypothetical protein
MCGRPYLTKQLLVHESLHHSEYKLVKEHQCEMWEDVAGKNWAAETIDITYRP